MIGFVVAACWSMGCPVGCPEGKPQSTFLGGPELVPTRRVGPCSVQFEDGIEYPRSDAGFYAVEINGLSELPEAFVYDARHRELTAQPSWCPGDAGTIEVKRYRWVRTVRE
ncbi:MAG TPA: hypothetical protein VFA20_21490 [Myxococcaceae bacterium]|nr:hypothetical protein [Myxococcaceae bacterium]